MERTGKKHLSINIIMQNITAKMRKAPKGVVRLKKHVLKVDMTPMVDLGFLLITFFILTAEMSKPTVSDLYMPKDGPSTKLGEKDALTIILRDHNQIMYYKGNFEMAMQKNTIQFTAANSPTGIRQAIQDMQRSFGSGQNASDNMMLLIKPTELASYGDVVGILDEVLINDVKKYAIMELSEAEKQFLAKF